MIYKKFFLFILLFCFSPVLSSCAGLATPPATSTPLPTLTPSSTSTTTPTPLPSPTPTLLPPTGLISFDSNRDGGWGIYIVQADGTGEVNMVTFSPGGDMYGNWSPDGKRIAFHSYRSGTTADIYLINADSTGLSRFTGDLANEKKPAWSPDGERIAFFSSENGDAPYEIYLMNIDDSELMLLASNAQGLTPPSWSPDGSRITFESSSGDYLEIFVINVDGSGLVQLTWNSTSVEPNWSPVGDRIAYVSVRNGSPEIFVMHADGSGVTQLTKNSTSYEPAWSPDGNYIAFTSERTGKPEIFLMRADGSGLRQLTDDLHENYAPRWAPEGVTMSSQPWFGPPFCMLDADGDFQPDTETAAFNSGELGYIMFPYRNMTNGVSFGHQWTVADSDFNPMFLSPWDGGSSGWHTSYSFVSAGAGDVSIQLYIEGQVVQEVVCGIIEP